MNERLKQFSLQLEIVKNGLEELEKIESKVNAQLNADISIKDISVKDADGNYIELDAQNKWLNSYLSGDEKEEGYDFYQTLEGFLNVNFNTDVDAENLKNIGEQIKSALSSLSEIWTDYYAEQVELSEQYLSDIRSRRAQVADELQLELQANEQGLASNVAAKQQELNELATLEKRALKERAAAQKREQVIQSITQGINLATAASNILADSTKLGPVGLIIGSIAIAALLQLFKGFKAQASAETRTFARGTGMILKGASHSQGGVNLGEVGEAEGGEFLGIASKKATRKHGGKLVELFNAINSGSEDDVARVAAKFDKGQLAAHTGIISIDLDKSKYLRGIYESVSTPQNVEYISNGYLIKKHGNVTQRIRL
mgnify:CR=1 FL=1